MSAKSVSLNPSSFSNSYLLRLAAEYAIPPETERRSKLSISGFPTKLLNVIYYTLPHRLEGGWRKSLANIERFLLSVGVPLLDKATSKCSLYAEMVTEAVDKDDDNRQNYLRSLRFLYSVEDMRITGGREIYQGGVPIQCLERDAQTVKDVQVRLGMTGVSQSALVTLAVVWALSTDTDCQVVSHPIQKTCQRVVIQFRERVVQWEGGLRGCDPMTQ